MKFTYKTIDKQGLEILDSMASAPAFNRWMYETISPWCQGRIIEVGSGVGNISGFFIRDKKTIDLSDVRSNYREVLKDKFALQNDKVLDLDIAHADFDLQYPHLLGKYDSVFALNVVEHIANDQLALRNMMALLKPGGLVTVLVPAYQSLYNGIDLSLEHFRRYNKKTLTALMKNFGPVQKAFYFNASGISAWWLSGKVLGQKTIPESEMKIYNFFVPLFRVFDRIVGNRMGLSVICVIQKP